MKIELSEVFVTRTDAITLESIPAPVGIAALEPRIDPIPANIKYRRFPLITAFYRFFPPFTAKTKKMFPQLPAFSKNLIKTSPKPVQNQTEK